jgi:hypothetical protein
MASVAMMAMPTGSPAEATDAGTASQEACLMQVTGETTCYADADALVSAVTGEPSRGLTNADLRRPEVVARLEAGLQADSGVYSRTVAATASYVNAIFYDGTFGNGASLNMVSPYQCDDNTDVDVQWATLTSSWRNRIRSGVGYGRCDFKVWDLANFGGASYGWTNNSATFGAMDGAAESVKMR